MKSLRIAIMSVVVLGIAWLTVGKNQVERSRFYTFDHEKWKNANESDRYFMAKYLIDQQMLTGKTKDEVSRLLGHASHDSESIMLYKLGSERGSIFTVDDDWLEITFGGRVDRLVVIQSRIRPD
jgi:hypothetical protein